ncbi:MAG: hypothetical protein LBC96_09950, partial [Lachnospiraceae bacterium]|nr:hypothetical protein [Lachnospiraceae bacterium]
MKRRLISIALLLVVSFLLGMMPSIPYNSYNFHPIDEQAEPMLTSMAPVHVITGNDLGAGDLDKPNDFRFGLDGLAYLADTNNDRILVLDADLTLKLVIDGFYDNEKWHTFNSPEGVFAEKCGTIFIADTGNRRIVVLDADASLNTLMDTVELTG